MGEENGVALTVRLSKPMHDLVREEAEAAGVSVAQLVREATLLRVAWARARRGAPIIAPADAKTIERVLEQLL